MILAAALHLLPPAAAHSVQPGLLGITRTAHHVELRWTPPTPEVPGLTPALPAGCATVVIVPDRAWSLDCPTDATLTMVGLERFGVPVVVRLDIADAVTTTLLTPDAPTLPLFPAPSPPATTRLAGWVRLGAAHVLSGLDHLLFLAGLLLLTNGAGGASGPRMVLATITAFTLAHSVTLAASVLGWVHIPRPPVEACIALSIVFVAREATNRAALAAPRGGRGRSAPTLAATFGLLHGLGFASGLDAAGIPPDALPTALFGFNLGVEAGQLLFVGGAMVLARAVHWATAARLDADTVRPWLAAGLGTVGAWWVWERVAVFAAG